MTYTDNFGARTQQAIDAGNVQWRDGFDPVAAGVSSTPKHTASTRDEDAAKLQKIEDDYRQKHPDPIRVKGPVVGAQTRQMMQLSEAMRRLRNGDAGQASADVHKLPAHVVRG